MVVLFIYWKIKTHNQAKKKETPEYERNSNVEEIIYRLYDLYREYLDRDMPMDYFFEKSDMYMRHYEIYPELRHRIMKNLERLWEDRQYRRKYSISEFRDILLYGFSKSNENSSHSFENTYLLENITERIQTIIKKELSRINKAKDYDYNSINSINENIVELKKILNSQNFETDKKQNTISIDNSSFQQQFIKELFHCLMTPISQVDASLSIIKAKIPQSDEILERSIKSIKAGIELTKSVLFAYRQVAFYTYHNTSEDALTIRDGIFSAELLYKGHNKKNIIFTDKNVPESIQGFSNYFILATLLPLLENAIYATNSEQQIEIEYISTEQDHIFKIYNPINSPISINDLYKDGFSSKKDNGKLHKGTGLSIVRNLIANIENSKLSFEFNNNILTTILQIRNNSKKL
jgi:K+-sensing histidine kinase KdpD